MIDIPNRFVKSTFEVQLEYSSLVLLSIFCGSNLVFADRRSRRAKNRIVIRRTIRAQWLYWAYGVSLPMSFTVQATEDTLAVHLKESTFELRRMSKKRT